jgi:hypothetical protein
LRWIADRQESAGLLACSESGLIAWRSLENAREIARRSIAWS